MMSITSHIPLSSFNASEKWLLLVIKLLFRMYGLMYILMYELRINNKSCRIVFVNQTVDTFRFIYN